MARDRVKTPETRRLKKTEIKFSIQLNEEQKAAKAIALDNTITIFTGVAGTSKTLLNCQIALDLVMSNQVGKILITRPTIIAGEGEGMGFLPGDAFDFMGGKMAPYIRPILETMFELKSKKEIEDLIKNDRIEIAPIDFVRGRNFKDCIVLVDEAQNLTYSQLKVLVTRICEGSKMLFTSDLSQVDLLDKSKSAGKLFELMAKRKGVALVELTHQFRHPLAVQLSQDIEEHEKEERGNKLISKIPVKVDKIETVEQLTDALEDENQPWNWKK